MMSQEEVMLGFLNDYKWLIVILFLMLICRLTIICKDRKREKENLKTLINYKNKTFIKYIKSIYFYSEGRIDKLLNKRNAFREKIFEEDFLDLKDKEKLLLSIKVEQTKISFDNTGMLAIAIALLGAFINLMPDVLNKNSTRWESSVVTIIYIVLALIFLAITSERSNIKANRAKLLKQYIDSYSQNISAEKVKEYQDENKKHQESVKKELESISADLSTFNKSIESLSRNNKYQSSQPSLIKALFKFIFKR